MGDFFFVQNEKNVVWGKFDNRTNRNYVLTDYVLSESVEYVSQCDLILNQRFSCVYSAFRQKFPKLWTSVAHSFLQQIAQNKN